LATEILAVDKVLLGLLSADPGVQQSLGFFGQGDVRNNPRWAASDTDVSRAVCSDVAPQGAVEPFILFTMEYNVDVNAIGGFRAMEPSAYSVKACASNIGYGGLKPVSDAIDACLQNYGPVVEPTSGVTVYKFVRDTTIRMSQNQNNVTWFYLGGVYSSMTSE